MVAWRRRVRVSGAALAALGVAASLSGCGAPRSADDAVPQRYIEEPKVSQAAQQRYGDRARQAYEEMARFQLDEWLSAELVSPNAPTPSPQQLTDMLALDATQRQQWEALEQPFLQDLSRNWEQIRQHREALVQAILAPTPDPAAIEREQARIAELQTAQQQRVIAQLAAERELLNDTQRAKLLALLLSRYSAEPTQEEQLHNK